jgi:hypothetical protein
MDIKELSVLSNDWKPASTSADATSSSVPGVGFEPTRPEGQALLRRRRLPVPTPGQVARC